MFVARWTRLFLAGLVAVAMAAPAFAQENAKEIMAKDAAALVQIVKDPAATAFAKAKACQRLAVVGTKDAIPALVGLLADENLNLYARFALEGIPDPAIEDALVAATSQYQGRQLVGILDSLGQRKVVKATAVLGGLLNKPSGDAMVAAAAAGALGRIGTPESAAILTAALVKKSPVPTAVADGCLACGEGLTASGKTAEAIALYGVVAGADVPKYLKIAALGAQFRLQKEAAQAGILAQLQSPDKAMFNLGLAAARAVPGAALTAALTEMVQKSQLPPDRQAMVLLALGSRTDQAPLAIFLAAAGKTAVPAVREAAIRVLIARKDPAAIAALLEAAFEDCPVAAVAKEGLTTSSDPQLDAAIVAKFAGADARVKAILIELVGARRIAAATTAIREALSDPNESIRLAAMDALGQLVEIKDLDLLTSRALAASETKEAAAARAALKTAALRSSDPNACAVKLGACLQGASAAHRDYLFDLLCKVSGPKALEIVTGLAKSTDAAVKDIATKSLGEWANPDAGPALLEIAKTDADVKYQVRALRGYVRIARQLSLSDDDRLAMFHAAMAAAKRNEEKQIALDILTRIPSPKTLQVAVASLKEPALKNAAAAAAVKIAEKIVSSSPKPVAEGMKKVVEAKVDAKSAERAKRFLEQAKAATK